MTHARVALVLLAITLGACDDKSATATPKPAGSATAVTKAPPAAPTVDEHALRLASTGKKPYTDKQILKTAIVAAWTPGEADGKKHEELIAAVTVYDPSNRKCWAWNKVTYRRSPGGSDIVQHAASDKDADIAEVTCASVGFTPPPQPKTAKKSSGSSGCRSGERMCGANCANLMTDRMNCGACGHECTGDKFACNNGQCW